MVSLDANPEPILAPWAAYRDARSLEARGNDPHSSLLGLALACRGECPGGWWGLHLTGCLGRGELLSCCSGEM